MTQAEQMVTIHSKGSTFEGYLARPEGEGPFPAVVVIHEIFGLNDNIKDIARRFAAAGYVALAVDLFAGRNRTVCMMRFMSQMMLTPLKKRIIQTVRLRPAKRSTANAMY